jgi:hypothetical protein
MLIARARSAFAGRRIRLIDLRTSEMSDRTAWARGPSTACLPEVILPMRRRHSSNSGLRLVREVNSGGSTTER